MKLPFTLQHLRIIKAIVYKKNFTKAAKMLFISQPTLSKQIQILENQLGIILINRTNNVITLTEAGKIFLQYSERILSLCEESCRTINDLKYGHRGNLIIGGDNLNSSYLIPRILTLFIKNYSQFSLKLYVNSTKKITKHISNKTIDLGIINTTCLSKQDKNLSIETIINDQLILIGPNQINLKKKKICKKNFYKLNWIKQDSNDTISKYIKTKIYKNNGKKLFKYIVKLHSPLAFNRAITLGLGFSFIFSLSPINNPGLNIVKLNNIKIIRTFQILTNSTVDRSKVLEVFIKELHLLNI